MSLEGGLPKCFGIEEMEKRWKQFKEGTSCKISKIIYSFITDHTGKEDNFFDLIEEKRSISDEEDEMLMRHYENCKNNVGGKERIEQMLKLVEYLENREWMKNEL